MLGEEFFTFVLAILNSLSFSLDYMFRVQAFDVLGHRETFLFYSYAVNDLPYFSYFDVISRVDATELVSCRAAIALSSREVAR